jgi:hypothetical protein
MQTRRFIILATAVVFILVAAHFATERSTHRSPTLDTSKVIAALQAFSREHVKGGQPLPATVSLRDLIARHYLTAADVRAFDGMEVTFSLTADETRPQQILIEARLPDGSRIASLADGSAQQLP